MKARLKDPNRIRNLISLRCARCGKPFLLPYSTWKTRQQRRGDRRFCSLSCVGSFTRGKRP